MTGQRAEVGDVVEDAQGQRAIVTDIRRNETWVLRPRWGPTTVQWETTEPDSLRVVQSRAARFSSGQDAW
ncbi:hypothetical protein ACIQ7D_16660 [Streptomyces sp. NPDC096310]|uniref:hypothetical protein n=1 Tax=Streptomyces sp. NPDC096310 TaxID=3366082 RepID=UPI0037F13501